MNFFARIGSAWGTLLGKAAPPGHYGAGWGGGSWFSDAFRSRRAPTPHELVDAYKSLVYACVNLNANAVARTPLRLYATTRADQLRPKCPVAPVSRKDALRLGRLGYATKAMAGVRKVEEVTDHPLLDVLMRVNDELDFHQLLTYTAMSLDIVGAAYWWPSIGRHGLPVELWALPPHLVSPQFTSGSMVPDSYQFGGVEYPRHALIRFRRLSARNPYGQGYGPEQAAIEYARLEDSFVSIQDDMLSNGPRPSVIVGHKDPKGSFGTAERARLEADMNRKGRGGRAGAAFVVDGAVAVTPISYSPTDLGIRDLSLYDLERIANCFDVPVSMLRTEDVNRANAEAGLEQHGRNAVEPRCKLIASTLTRWTHSLDPRGARGWDRLLWAFDPAVKEDARAEAELHKTYVAMGLPLNVALTEAGYDAIEGGDVPLVPAGLKPLASVIGRDADAVGRPPTTSKNCGTGAGGFQPGNTCAQGRDGPAPDAAGQERRPPKKPRQGGPARMSARPPGAAGRGRGPTRTPSAATRPAPGSPATAPQRPAATPAPDDRTGPAASGGITENLRGIWDEFQKVKGVIANLDREERALVLDVVGLALDVAGIFEPTPFSDLTSTGLSAYRGQYRDALLSFLGVFPALGDLAKVGKIRSYVKKVERAIALARKRPRFAALVRPILGKLGKLLDGLDVPIRGLPEGVSGQLTSLRHEIKNLVARAPVRIGSAFNSAGRMPRSGTRPVLAQATNYDCAPTCVSMVLATIDPGRSSTNLVKLGMTRSGTSVDRLPSLLKANGIMATWRRGYNIDDIARATARGQPLIATVGRHAVVIDGVTTRMGKRVLAIRDPAGGKQYYELATEFTRHFTGQVVTLP